MVHHRPNLASENLSVGYSSFSYSGLYPRSLFLRDSTETFFELYEVVARAPYPVLQGYCRVWCMAHTGSATRCRPRRYMGLSTRASSKGPARWPLPLVNDPMKAVLVAGGARGPGEKTQWPASCISKRAGIPVVGPYDRFPFRSEGRGNRGYHGVIQTNVTAARPCPSMCSKSTKAVPFLRFWRLSEPVCTDLPRQMTAKRRTRVEHV